jgi:hypothetical protein
VPEWSSLGPDVEVDVKTATFVGADHVGPDPIEKVTRVTVTNSGSIPLKVVILDEHSKELGRTSDYKTGSFSIALNPHVSKYRWEVFAPGDKEPCQEQRDETKSSITVQRQRSKAAEKAAH